ncbi:MAG TPA: hypothetical protein VG322_00025 [Candidatus Acidoferrales bacterium]|nr:hypothetical protein [Candidatus Acidoferrales bacterium]
MALLVLVFGTQARAQQPQQSRLSASYARAAQASLQAIESDDSSSQEPSRAIVEVLDAADKRAGAAEELMFAKLLRQVQLRRLQDNDLLHAYGKLIEVENAIDDSEGTFIKRQKESELSQLADGEEGIMRREVGCFKQLELSLAQRSFQDAPACSAWIQRSKTAHQDSLIRQ